ncbi:MAG: hypothetical protein AVDCRST_MAG01-01-3924 [uncultured Rubrobacteraceae bacterium]|uniref:Uncharacterized protein n=1 Tax=uncultured Rubrobacteraceae bacterium TaxID=349277 RepID=A0A6J4QMD5_9ACTN|nr:MAG: hypothetical protein AVDCRST_MAG01-01-3924 [uncultured Rubrobacteraceae bacterium]
MPSSSSLGYPKESHALWFTSTRRPSRSCTNIASAACSTSRRNRISLRASASSARVRSLRTSASLSSRSMAGQRRAMFSLVR